MTPFTSEAVSTLAQVLLFSTIPWVCFLFRKNKALPFYQYIGFYWPTPQSILYALASLVLLLAVGIGFIWLNPAIYQLMVSSKTITGQLHTKGLTSNSIAILLLVALLKTSLSEEILFRGFIAKQLVNQLGFPWGNLLQALLFGSVHLLLFGILTPSSWLVLLFIFGFTSLGGWSIGYGQAKLAGGSIIPGWLTHGLINTITFLAMTLLGIK